MAQVKVPNEFFAKSKLEYSDWRWAFFRELIQNSYDAGASRIDFSVSTTEESHVVRCTDNGRGMSRDVLENVLLCLGGSKKEDGAVGGFGYAKSLLFFAHQGYEIRTLDHVVQGAGGDYSISESADCVRGTKIEVRMAREPMSSELDIMNSLYGYAKYLNVPRSLVVSVNGLKIETQFSDYDCSVATALGQFSFKDTSDGKSRVIVAVRGLPMFVQNVYASGQASFSGLLELSGDTFELLTANRDGLKYSQANELTRIIQRMTENRSTLKLGTPVVVRLNRTAPNADATCSAPGGDQAPAAFTGTERAIQQIHDYVNVEYPTNFNVRLHSVVGNARAKAAGTVSVTEVVSLLKKSWIKSLAQEWKSAVYRVLATEHFRSLGIEMFHSGSAVTPSGVEYCKYDADALEFYFSGVRISVGFVLAEGIEGLNSRTNSGDDVQILINPNMYDKQFIVGDLIDLAIHECAHIRVSGHNESFVDEDMKIRRSLRRFMATTKTVKGKSK